MDCDVYEQRHTIMWKEEWKTVDEDIHGKASVKYMGYTKAVSDWDSILGIVWVNLPWQDKRLFLYLVLC